MQARTAHPALVAAPAGVVLLDADGTVAWVNDAGRALLGDLEGPFESVLPFRLRAEHRAGLQRLRWAEGADDRLGWAVLTSDGERAVDLRVVATGDDPPFAVWLTDREPHRVITDQLERTRGLLADARRMTDVGTWEWDLAEDRLTWSEELYAMAGRDPAVWSASIEGLIEITHPDDRDIAREAVRRLVDTGVGATWRARFLRPDGEERQIVITQQTAVTGGGGRPTLFFGIARDVTAEPDAMPRRLLDELLSWEQEGEGGVRLLARIATALGVAGAALWLPDPDTGRITLRAFFSDGADLHELEEVSRRGEVVPGTGVAGRAWALGRPVLVPDVLAEEAFRRRGAASRGGIVSAAAVPATAAGEVLAVVEVFADGPVAASADPALLELAGAQVGALLARTGRRLVRPELTPREREVLQLAADGLSVGAVAERLVLSPATVKTHFQKVFDKLGVRDRAAAVAEGMRLGLVV